MNRFNRKKNKILNFELTFISSIITFLELGLTLVFKNNIAINLFLTQISGFISCIIFIDELKKYNILKQLENEEELEGRLYYSGLLKSECKKDLSIEILIVILILIMFFIVPVI